MRRCSRGRAPLRGFNLIEMLIALAISSMLLTATMIALDASFMAYQATTEQASTHTIARLIMQRIMSTTRIAQEYGPYPAHPQVSEIYSDLLELRMPSGQLIGYRFDPAAGVLYFQQFGPPPGDAFIAEHELMRGIINDPDVADLDGDSITSEQQPPFVLEYELGRQLYRMCCHLVIEPDDVQHLDIEGDFDSEITLDFCVIPRVESYDDGPGSG